MTRPGLWLLLFAFVVSAMGGNVVVSILILVAFLFLLAWEPER